MVNHTVYPPSEDGQALIFGIMMSCGLFSCSRIILLTDQKLCTLQASCAAFMKTRQCRIKKQNRSVSACVYILLVKLKRAKPFS